MYGRDVKIASTSIEYAAEFKYCEPRYKIYNQEEIKWRLIWENACYQGSEKSLWLFCTRLYNVLGGETVEDTSCLNNLE